MEYTIKQLIRQGEHQQQDFKFRVDDARKIARSLVAFANTDGGQLLVGVKDNGKIAGVDSDEEFFVVEAAANLYSKPEIQFETQAWAVDGKTVLEVAIAKAAERPHYAKNEEGNWIPYVRKDDMNLVANRVLQRVWKQQVAPRGARVKHSKTEKVLFAYLREHGHITFSKFCRISRISSRKAETILVKLISWNILRIELSEKGAAYCFASQKHE